MHAEIYGHAKLFCGPLRVVVCGVKTPHVRLAIWPIFARRQHLEASTAGCKTGFRESADRAIESITGYDFFSDYFLSKMQFLQEMIILFF
jgi:hypothetical protein